jgi:ATP adenylyltransferase
LNKSQTEECLFCTLPKDDADRDNLILYRGRHAFVLLNRYPYSNGHLMVVAYRHVGHFSDMSVEESGEVINLVTRCEKALLDAYKPGGLNVGVNMGRSAGAGILDHLHVHVVPRWHGDTNFMTAVGEARVVSEDLAESYSRLQPFFTSG